MQGGWLNRLDPHRRWIAQAVILLFSVPVLLGLLPAPDAPAATALERDIAASLCGSPGSGPSGGEQGHLPHHPDCILCAVCAAAAGPALAGAAPAFAGRPNTVSQPAPLTALSDAHPAVLRSGSPPRGPPALLLV